MATWIQGNLVAVKPVTSFDPATDTVYHEDLGGNPYTDRTSYYSMLNHAALISRPGEYAYDPRRTASTSGRGIRTAPVSINIRSG